MLIRVVLDSLVVLSSLLRKDSLNRVELVDPHTSYNQM